MSAVAIGLIFTVASLLLFGISWFLAMSADRQAARRRKPRPLEDWQGNLPPSGNDNEISRLERSRSV